MCYINQVGKNVRYIVGEPITSNKYFITNVVRCNIWHRKSFYAVISSQQMVVEQEAVPKWLPVGARQPLYALAGWTCNGAERCLPPWVLWLGCCGTCHMIDALLAGPCSSAFPVLLSEGPVLDGALQHYMLKSCTSKRALDDQLAAGQKFMLESQGSKRRLEMPKFKRSIPKNNSEQSKGAAWKFGVSRQKRAWTFTRTSPLTLTQNIFIILLVPFMLKSLGAQLSPCHAWKIVALLWLEAPVQGVAKLVIPLKMLIWRSYFAQNISRALTGKSCKSPMGLLR